MRIEWLRDKDLAEPAWFAELLSPLQPHLNAAGRTPESSNYAALVVEDFGTSGLTGPTDEPGDAGNFRGFFYRHSISGKGGTAGGRWGLGKLVFARMSGWSCWFGLTARADGRALLMGKAAIGPRPVEGKRYPGRARSKASVTLPSRAGRLSMTGLSGPSRISDPAAVPGLLPPPAKGGGDRAVGRGSVA